MPARFGARYSTRCYKCADAIHRGFGYLGARLRLHSGMAGLMIVLISGLGRWVEARGRGSGWVGSEKACSVGYVEVHYYSVLENVRMHMRTGETDTF